MAFYLRIFSRSSTLIGIFMIICFNLHNISLRYQFAISSQAPSIWNDIPLTVRNNLTTTNFKKNLTLYFLSLNWISAGFSYVYC